jgi:hypothetical protein
MFLGLADRGARCARAATEPMSSVVRPMGRRVY